MDYQELKQEITLKEFYEDEIQEIIKPVYYHPRSFDQFLFDFTFGLYQSKKIKWTKTVYEYLLTLNKLSQKSHLHLDSTKLIPFHIHDFDDDKKLISKINLMSDVNIAYEYELNYEKSDFELTVFDHKETLTFPIKVIVIS